MDGLGEDLKFMPLGASLFEEVGCSGLAGEEKDLAVGHAGAGGNGGFNAGHAGHNDIRDEHVGLEGVERFQSLLSTVDGAGLEACLIKNDGEGIGDHLFIVGDEDAWLGRCGGGCFRHA